MTPQKLYGSAELLSKLMLAQNAKGSMSIDVSNKQRKSMTARQQTPRPR